MATCFDLVLQQTVLRVALQRIYFVEKQKFFAELPTYQRRGHHGLNPEGDIHSSVDFPRWASDWNNHVRLIEPAQFPWWISPGKMQPCCKLFTGAV